MTPHAAARRWAETGSRPGSGRDADAIVALYAEGTVVSTAPFRRALDLAGQRACVTRVFG